MTRLIARKLELSEPLRAELHGFARAARTGGQREDPGAWQRASVVSRKYQ